MDRTSQPAFHKTLDFKLPQPEVILSSGKREILYIPSSVGEAVKIEVVFEAGKLYEEFPGIAQFTTQLLDKGIKWMNAHEIANTLDYYGAHLELKTGFDYSSASLYALKKNLGKLLPIFFELINAPLFPEEELILYAKIFSENLKVSLKKNDFLAANMIREKIFGDHPYGRKIEPGDVERITLGSINSFFNTHFTPCKVFIVGSVDKQHLESVKKGVNVSKSQKIKHGPSIRPIAASNEVLEGPNKIQAAIRLGQKSIDRSHKDLPGLMLVNHLLGGFFGSRLMKNVREEKGLTYSIYSTIQHHQTASVFTIAAEVNSEKVDQAIEAIHVEIRLADLTDKELEITKNHLIGSVQNDISTVFAAADRIKMISLSNLPFNYYEKLIQELDRLTVSQAEEIGTKYLQEKNLSLVVVK
jgi:predicted Zn-dependent peptidase